jgi:hypothetical protein
MEQCNQVLLYFSRCVLICSTLFCVLSFVGGKLARFLSYRPHQPQILFLSSQPQSHAPNLDPLQELKIATKNFRQDCLLGEGGFGRVYAGKLEGTGQVVAVKQLDREGSQGHKEFMVRLYAGGDAMCLEWGCGEGA